MADSRTEYKAEFNREKYDRFLLTVPKGGRDIVKAAAMAKGESVNQFIIDALRIAYGLDLAK